MRIGNRTIELTHQSKLYFPDEGLTKGDLIEYYERAAELILPHVKDRPISMERYPDGIEKSGFFHKAVPDHFPDWIDSCTVATADGDNRQVVINKAATLVYLANFGSITPHVWLSRADRLHTPDRMVFDLDPSEDDFEQVRKTSLAIRKLFDEMKVATFVQLTGSRGMHVVVPLRREHEFDAVRAVDRDVGKLLVERDPGGLTIEQRKDKREGRLFLDTNRNAYGQTMVAPYTVRARPGAPVATPVDWDEAASSSLSPTSFTVANLIRRMGQRDDPWSGMSRRAVSLDTIREKLAGVSYG